MKKIIVKKEYYVYVYFDPRKQGKYIYGKYEFSCEPIYVGKGKRKRAYYYEQKNSYLDNKLAKIGKPVILIVAKELSENKAFKLEKELIGIIGRSNLNRGPLCNFTDGGEGASGAVRSEETKKKMSKSITGKIITKETREKISKALKGNKNGAASNLGRTFSKEWREKISNSLVGRKQSKDTRGKISISKKGSIPWNKGRNHSKETKEKISASKTGCKYLFRKSKKWGGK